jgi:hypothetical protein
VVTRSLRCAGLARTCANLPKNWAEVVTGSAIVWWAALLHELGYSLQANAKTLEDSLHLDRNAQFEHIHRKVRRFLKQGQSAISVDTKKKELVGDFKKRRRRASAQGGSGAGASS